MDTGKKLRIIKEKSQIFTPTSLIQEMVKKISGIDKLYQMKTLENSCGDGRILKEIVKLYIESCLEHSLTKNQIIHILQENIIAFEIDENLKSKCIKNLNDFVSDYGFSNIIWNIKCEDYLENKDNENVDLIIGNPPYIAYPNLDEQTRKYLKDNYISCKEGKFDYYYAFIEKSYHALKHSGRMIYLVPSNFFKNVYAKNLRNLLIKDLVSISDYPDSSVFENALVSPSIIEIKKSSSNDSFSYTNKQKKHCKSKRVLKADFEDKWIFVKQSKKKKKRFGDFFKASICIATLSNDVFVLKNGRFDENEAYYIIKNYKIESGLIRKAASPNGKRRESSQEYIIFPYYYDKDNKRKRYTEDEISSKFPKAFYYLQDNKEVLKNRASDNNAKWYEYGRSQALDYMNCFPMILISSIISHKTKAYKLIDEIPYSGIFILPKDGNSIDEALKLLNSDDFKNYISNVGVCLSGTSRRITPKDIEEFYYYGE